MGSRTVLFLAFLSAASPAFGQSVISARSGVVNYFEGDVVANGERLSKSYGSYPRLHEGSDLVTRSGRVELLLAPNIYLRLGSDSSVRMVSNDLTDTKLELTGGSAILDSTAPEDQNTPVTLLFHGSEIRVRKQGQYRIDAEPPQFRVYQGAAEITRDGSVVKLGASQLFPLDGAPVVRKFTEGSDNLLDVWSDERHLLISSKLTDAATIHDPLLDPDPDPATGLDAYLGYMPLTLQSQQPAGIYSGVGGYGTYSSINPYGGYSYGMYPYGASPYYGFLGVTPLIIPSYTPVRFGTIYVNRPVGSLLSRPIGTLPGLTGARPIGTPSLTSPIRPGMPIGAPRPIGRVGGIGRR